VFEGAAVDAVRHADVECARAAADDVDEVLVILHKKFSPSVILSGVAVREANGNAVERSRVTRLRREIVAEFSRLVWEHR
jgi:RNase P protein component